MNLFIKANHKNATLALMILFICLLIVVVVIMFNRGFHIGYIVFLIITLISLALIANILNNKGFYIVNDKLYWKAITKKEVDLSKIVGVKIIKAEAQVNLAWSTFDLKGKDGELLKTIFVLRDMEEDMLNYKFGDIEFAHKYRKCILYQSIYDEMLIEFLRNNIKELTVA